MRPVVFLLSAFATLSLGQGARPSAFDASAFTPLFDGRTLDGWITKGGRYDGNAQWTVEDGVICGREGADHGRRPPLYRAEVRVLHPVTRRLDDAAERLRDLRAHGARRARPPDHARRPRGRRDRLALLGRVPESQPDGAPEVDAFRVEPRRGPRHRVATCTSRRGSTARGSRTTRCRRAPSDSRRRA